MWPIVAAIAVPVALAFGFDDGVNPPGGTVGTPYSFQFKGRNGCPPYTFVLKSGALPPGLSVDSGGTVSGTPTEAAASRSGWSYTTLVRASLRSGRSRSA